MSLSTKADYAAAKNLGISVEEFRARWNGKKWNGEYPILVNGKPLKSTEAVRRKPTPSRRDEVIARDGERCRYCGRSVQIDSLGASMLTLDHLTPRSRGGTNVLANLVVACGSCNQQKGDLTLAEYGVALRPPQSGPVEADSTTCPDCTDGFWAQGDGRECPTCGGVGELSAGRAVRLFLDSRAKVATAEKAQARLRSQVNTLTAQIEDRDGIGAAKRDLAHTVQSLLTTVGNLSDRVLILKVQLSRATGDDLTRMIPNPAQRERALRLDAGEVNTDE